MFLSGEKHRIGFLDDQDVIRSGAAQEVPDEVLEQLAEEEAEVDAWMQAERTKASMGSTDRSRPSGEDSGERLHFDSGAGSSSRPTRRSKRKRGQRRHGRRYDDSPDSDVPLATVEEASEDDDEHPEKRSREEEISDGMTFLLSFPASFFF